MDWTDLHRQSAELAFEAGKLRLHNASDARGIYRHAAELEIQALRNIGQDKERTRGIIGVSAASLLFKAGEFEEAEKVSLELLNARPPEDIKTQLQAVLHAVWTEVVKRDSHLDFISGQVVVSLSGGEVVAGGAPLELVLSRVQTVQSMFVRTVEYLSHLPARKHEKANQQIKDMCRPWLFQAPPGSYQFAVAIEAPKQADLFKLDVNPREITDKFLDILAATSSGSDELLEETVRDEDYRRVFLKLTKSLSPTGRNYEKLRVYSYDNPREVTISQDARQYVNEVILEKIPSEEKVEQLVGTLRALDLDRDWLEVEVEGKHRRVVGLEDAIDDVIGPMVNRKVRVTVRARGPRLHFVDMEEI